MSFSQKSSVLVVLFLLIGLISSAALIAQQKADGDTPFLYPDPRTVGVHPYHMQGKPPGAAVGSRYAGVSEHERQMRALQEYRAELEGLTKGGQPPCPLCEEGYKTPCGECKMCTAGFPCEKTLCRHCVQPRSKNMGNSCDLAAGDEPCGTCDACREHRSDPCGHADEGYGPRGEFNPYREPRLMSVIPRPLLNTYNNGAKKFPVYYNPAPYYRPTWNPSLYAGYARPFTFRWTCGLCSRDPCGCNMPGLAGQVPYVYACKFCNRNPCACAQDICNVNKPMDPKGIAQALTAERKEPDAGTQPQPLEIRETPGTEITQTPSASYEEGGGIPVEGLFDDAPKPDLNELLRIRPSLDTSLPEMLP